MHPWRSWRSFIILAMLCVVTPSTALAQGGGASSSGSISGEVVDDVGGALPGVGAEGAIDVGGDRGRVYQESQLVQDGLRGRLDSHHECAGRHA